MCGSLVLVKFQWFRTSFSLQIGVKPPFSHPNIINEVGYLDSFFSYMIILWYYIPTNPIPSPLRGGNTASFRPDAIRGTESTGNHLAKVSSTIEVCWVFAIVPLMKPWRLMDLDGSWCFFVCRVGRWHDCIYPLSLDFGFSIYNVNPGSEALVHWLVIWPPKKRELLGNMEPAADFRWTNINRLILNGAVRIFFFRERAWKSVYSCNQIRIKSIAAAVGGSAVASAFNSLLTERILKGDKARLVVVFEWDHSHRDLHFSCFWGWITLW